MKYLVFGSLNIDRTYSVPHFVSAGETLSATKMEIFCGGKGFNQAIALARAGKEVYFAGAVGSDGQILLDALNKNGICTKYIEHTEAASGHAVIQVDKSGQNSIMILPGANDEITEAQVDRVLADFETGDLIVLQNEISAVAYIMRKAKEKGMLVALNPSPFNRRVEEYDMNCVDYLLVNEVEGAAITDRCAPDEIVERLRTLYPQINLILTLGSRGSIYAGKDGNIARIGIYQTKVVDTTAAGDTFTGYFLARITEKVDALYALKQAAIASGISVSGKGAEPSIPYLQEVEKVDTATLSDFREHLS